MVRAYLETARRLEVVLIGWLVEGLGAFVPAVRLRRSLIAAWTLMRLAMGGRWGTVLLAGVISTVFVSLRFRERGTARDNARSGQGQTQFERRHSNPSSSEL
jgi:hypothetical protein